MTINKHILKAALVDKDNHCLAQLLNHFKIGPEWFNRPLTKPEELVKWGKILLLEKHPRESMSLKDWEELSNKFKKIHPDVYYEDGQYHSKVLDTALYDDYMAYINASEDEEIFCPECYEIAEETGTYNYKHYRKNYTNCLNCGTFFRNEYKPLGDNVPEYRIQDVYDCQLVILQDLFYRYCKHIDEQGFQGLYISGRNLNWRGSSGYAEVSIDPDELFETFQIRGDYTLQVHWMYDGTLEVLQSHHDSSPFFTVTPVMADCITGELIPEELLEESKKLAEIANILDENDFLEHVHPHNWYYNDYGQCFNQLSDEILEIMDEIGSGMTPKLSVLLMRMENSYVNN